MGVALRIDPSLELGAVADTVEVTAATTLLETESSSTGTILQGDFFYRMPLFQRSAKRIMDLTPGVTISGFGYGGDMGGYQINGESSDRIREEQQHGGDEEGGDDVPLWDHDGTAETAPS